MNNRNNPSNFRLQSSQKIREIENQLEREISGIVNKQKSFGQSEHRYNGMNESVSSKLKSFLDERLAKRNAEEKGFNEDAYEQSLDYQYDSDYNNQNQVRSKLFDNNNEEDYYEEQEFEEEDDYYDEDEAYDGYENGQYEEEQLYEDIKKTKVNPNSYLPFTYEELQPEMPNEEVLLDAMMPAIAQWLDLNIDRIVHKVVKDSLSNRGQADKYSARYSERGAEAGVERATDRVTDRGALRTTNRVSERGSHRSDQRFERENASTGYVKEPNYSRAKEPQAKASQRVERVRVAESIKSIHSAGARSSSRGSSAVKQSASRPSSALKKPAGRTSPNNRNTTKR